jgi:hypothetical protein
MLLNLHFFEANGKSDNQLILKNIFSVEPKRMSRVKDETFVDKFNIIDDDSINGFKLHTFQYNGSNNYQHKSILFKHPNQQTCKTWLKQLYGSIKSIQLQTNSSKIIHLFSTRQYSRFWVGVDDPSQQIHKDPRIQPKTQNR